MILQATGDSVAATAVTLTPTVLGSGYFREGSTFVFGNGVDVITGQAPDAAVADIRTATNELLFENQFTIANTFVDEFWVGGARTGDISLLLPGQLINAEGGPSGFYNGAGGTGLSTTQQGFYVAGTWNSGTSTFTASAPSTPGNDALVFTVAANVGYDNFVNAAFAAAFFTNGSSAFILDVA